ncbi:hypothetical protein Bca52824_000586 [Brassica carinata]|uniref:Uncharacterized protein n=1 Tax=Brassica carinata TaxID=52824 RepID=A0A8X7WGV4_BRACI|nr:hypothetical protein Bca52824_000586 [Brassica carinata]
MLLMDVDLRIMKHRVIAEASKDEDSLHRFAWMGFEVNKAKEGCEDHCWSEPVKVSLLRSLSSLSLIESGPMKLSPTIGISVEHRLGGLQSNIQTLKTYKANLVIFLPGRASYQFRKPLTRSRKSVLCPMRVSPSFTQVFASGIMSIISSVAGLAKEKEICRVAKVKRSLIMGDKLVTQALVNMDAHVTLLIVATDGGCADHVATAIEHQIPFLKLSTRLEVG